MSNSNNARFATPSPLPKRVAELSMSTPYRSSTSSFTTASHTKGFVDPFVRNDMKMFTKTVTVDQWVKAVCGVDADKLEAWATCFKEKGLFLDGAISEQLDRFSRAKREEERYKPTAEVFERVLEVAAASTNELEDFGGPLFSDICLLPHDAKVMRAPEDQAKLAARRKPDVLVVRTEVKKNAETKNNGQDGDRVNWTDALMCMELKRDTGAAGRLPSKLQQERRKRGGAGNEETSSKELLASLEAASSTRDASDTVVTITTGTEDLEVSETASTGSKRSRDSDTLEYTRETKRSRGSESQTSAKWATDISTEDQIGGYALEILASTRGTRLHSIVVALRDELVSLWYFDASGVVRTCSHLDEVREELCLFKDFERIAAIFVALSCCDPKRLGALPSSIFTPPSDRPFPQSFPLSSLAGCTIEMGGTSSEHAFPKSDPRKGTEIPQFTVTLGRHVYSQYALIGRRSNVYEGTTPIDADRVIVKFSQQYVTRTSEVTLLKKAHACNIEHLPTIISSKDFMKLSSDDSIRAAFDVEYDDRVFRLIVMPYYIPLAVQLASHPDSLVTMVKQLISCIHDLRHKAHILHRDISQGNIMYKESPDGIGHFILGDFDLATFVQENGQPLSRGPSSRHCTGTLPFMAFDLVHAMAKGEQKKGGTHTSFTSRMRHCVRFDFESLFWVAVWCAVRVRKPQTDGVDEGGEESDHYVTLWGKGTYTAIAGVKRTIMTTPGELESAPLSPAFQHLQGWLLAFKRPFTQAIVEEMTADDDYIDEESDMEQRDFCSYETGYGKVTRDTLMKALETYEAKRAAKRKTGSSRVG